MPRLTEQLMRDYGPLLSLPDSKHPLAGLCFIIVYLELKTMAYRGGPEKSWCSIVFPL